MLTEYINAAMEQAEYKLLEDGTYFGEIPPCPGVWGNASTLKACMTELQEVLEEWILLGLKQGQALPEINGINLNIRQQEVA
ncbi:MAG TPA: type II toxin-antitoxin system HicB family antitoxin [Chroococcidiopsis sp.]